MILRPPKDPVPTAIAKKDTPVTFAEMFKHYYPPGVPPAERNIDGFGPSHWRPLKCVVCGCRVSRHAYKRWGNPYCGPHFPGYVSDIENDPRKYTGGFFL